MATNPSRPLNPHIKLVRVAKTDAFEVLLDELKLWRKDEGRRGWGKLEPEVLRVITLITLDLFSAWSTSPELLVGYSRNANEFLKGGRYWDNNSDKKLFTETIFLGVIDGLAALDYLVDKRAKQGTSGISSRIKATHKLIDIMKDNGINWAAIDASPEPSKVITLTTKKDGNNKKHLMEFDDSADEQIPAMREGLVKINDRLRETLINLSVSDDELKAINRRLADGKEREMIDFTKRYLVRKFTDGDFNSGGRYYGGWFQQVPREYRSGIIINDSPTAEWNFKTLHPAILYLKSGLTPPEDSYDLPGWDKEHRDLYKKTFNQILNSSKSTRSKNQWHRLSPDLTPTPKPDGWDTLKQYEKTPTQRELFVELTGCDYNELIEAILEKHKPIEHHLFSQAWSWLQKIGSDIAEMVMLDMLENHDEVILPLHDSFIVRVENEKKLYELLHESMERAFEEVLGKEPIIDLKQGAKWEGDVETQVATIMENVKNFKTTHSEFMKRNAEWVQVWT